MTAPLRKQHLFIPAVNTYTITLQSMNINGSTMNGVIVTHLADNMVLLTLKLVVVLLLVPVMD